MCKMCIRDVQEVHPETQEARTTTMKTKIMFDQLRGLKIKHKLVTDPSSESIQKQVAYQPDMLAVSTQLSKEAYEIAKAAFQKFQKTNAYAVVTRTTQPLYLVLSLLVACSYFITYADSESTSYLRLWKVLYAGGIAVHLGAQFWMTFISGIVLYFSLPRHAFGRVQEVLFPIYFAFNSLVLFITLMSYLKIQSISKFQSTSWIQIVLLLVSLMIEATVRLYFVKPMLKMKHLKTQMEEAADGGQEVGKLILGELAHCPHYMKILKSFRAHHSKIAMGNMISFGCSIYSLMILADSLCFV